MLTTLLLLTLLAPAPSAPTGAVEHEPEGEIAIAANPTEDRCEADARCAPEDPPEDRRTSTPTPDDQAQTRGRKGDRS